MQNGYSICFNQWALDKEIKNELGLLLIISSLCAEKGYCYASNKYLAEQFGITEVSISTKIKKLEKKNYITIEYEKRGCEIISRKIRLKNILIDDLKKFKPTIKENFKENNTSNNNTSNNKKENILKEKYGKLNNVNLTLEEYNKLKEQFVDYEEKIDNLSYYIGSTGKKYQSHYLTILNWSRKESKSNNKTAYEKRQELYARLEEELK